MSVASAFESYEAHFKSLIMQDTWGHLFPKEEKYEGTIKIASSMYDGMVVLDEEIDISGSPWWYHSLHNFVNEFESEMEVGEVRTIPIVVVVETTDKGSQIVITHARFVL